MLSALNPQRRAKLLIVDDTPNTARLLALILEELGDCVVTTDSRTALNLAREHHPDLVLLDIAMPYLDGFEVLAALKADPLTSTTPVIFLTSLSDRAIEEHGLAAGAMDYITKPFSKAIVLSRVRNQLSIRFALEQLQHQAVTDSATGVYNRRYFLEVAGREFERYTRYGNRFCIAILDIDYFKAINDRYGHAMGDAALVHLVQECRTLLRHADTLARFGGEEFALLLPETMLPEALPVAERIRLHLAATPVPAATPPIRFTVSIGVADCLGEASLNAIIKRADDALYRAKAEGRNAVRAG